jgi:hypothetical protein
MNKAEDIVKVIKQDNNQTKLHLKIKSIDNKAVNNFISYLKQ